MWPGEREIEGVGVEWMAVGGGASAESQRKQSFRWHLQPRVGGTRLGSITVRLGDQTLSGEADREGKKSLVALATGGCGGRMK